MEKSTEEKVRLRIQHFCGKEIDHEDVVDFTGEGLETLREIDEDPKKAVILALQIAVKMKRFDASSKGSFTLQSQRMRGKFEVPEWSEK